MTDAGRIATLGGFFVGRLTGRIRLPGEGYNTTIDIYDPDSRSWRSFPSPLLTNPAGQRDQRDVLPALLESMVIAMAQCHADPMLTPLLPYRLMRELYDDNADVPFRGDPAKLAAARHLTQWIVSGTTQTGVMPNAASSGSAQDTVESRQAAVLAYLEGFREFIGREYLAPGELGAPGGGTYSTLDHTPLWDVPLFHEIAPDAYNVLDTLRTLVTTVSPTTPPGFEPVL